MSTAAGNRQVSVKYYDEAYATKQDLEGLEFYYAYPHLHALFLLINRAGDCGTVRFV